MKVTSYELHLILFNTNPSVMMQVYYFVKTISRWKTRKPDLRVSMLCVDNDIEDGTFVGILYSVS